MYQPRAIQHVLQNTMFVNWNGTQTCYMTSVFNRRLECDRSETRRRCRLHTHACLVISSHAITIQVTPPKAAPRQPKPPMRPTTLDDDAEVPPPSAQQRPSYVPAGDGKPSTSASAAGVRIVPSRPRVATHPARTRTPVADHNSELHNHHTPLASHMDPLPASFTTAKPTASSKPPAIPPPRLPSGVVAPARNFFDPWNSSSTGHQRAENRLSGSTSWRQSRSLKLTEQYKGGPGGGKRAADTVGAGSEGFGKDGRKPGGGWEKGAKGLRTGGQKSLAETWGNSRATASAKRSSPTEENMRHSVPPDDTVAATATDQGMRIPTSYVYVRSSCCC